MNEENPVNVLAIDDDPVSLLLMREVLKRLGHTAVTLCRSGRAALEQMDQSGSAPDLIMLDLNMPGMDGLEFVRHLVQRDYRGGLVLCSGENSRVLQTAQTLVRAHAISMLGHLSKPVSAERLEPLLQGLRAERAVQRKSPQKRAIDPAELDEAIRAGQLVNYYQPQIDVASGSVAALEALVRWRHPSEGLVTPDRFIGVAESHGLIEALTHTVLSNALADLAETDRHGYALRVAVNVSMHNLVSVEFADYVVAAAERSGISPDRLTLEVTESELMRDCRVPLEVLVRLRMKRFGLSIDDFGTGHSSLAQLRDIPFNELKVDRGFVHEAANNPTLKAIFDNTLRLASELEMSVVAEGVEDDADWQLVRESGCALAQGYHFARPMPAAQLLEWLPGWQGDAA